jgi:hypothetical protein
MSDLPVSPFIGTLSAFGGTLLQLAVPLEATAQLPIKCDLLQCVAVVPCGQIDGGELQYDVNVVFAAIPRRRVITNFDEISKRLQRCKRQLSFKRDPVLPEIVFNVLAARPQSEKRVVIMQNGLVVGFALLSSLSPPFFTALLNGKPDYA